MYWNFCFYSLSIIMVIITVRCFYRVFKMCPEIKDFTYFYAEHPEKAMATHSSTLAWKIPGTEELVGCGLWGLTESDSTEVI